MDITEFVIGEKFFFGKNEYVCTDKGTRTVTAIEVDPLLDSGWYEGPPYRLPEISLDENDLKICAPLLKEAIKYLKSA